MQGNITNKDAHLILNFASQSETFTFNGRKIEILNISKFISYYLDNFKLDDCKVAKNTKQKAFKLLLKALI